MPQDAPPEAAPPERIPWQQILLDDIFLLLAFGLAVPTILYIVWGLIELGNVPTYGP